MSWLLAVAVALLIASGCGGGRAGGGSASKQEAPAAADQSTSTAAPTGPETPEINVSVEGWKNPSDLGILVASQKGFFEDEGLNVWVGAPATPGGPIHYVSEGSDTFGVTPLPQVVMAKEKGAPITALGSLVSEPTAAMIWLQGSGIHDLADLRGKTIAIPGLPFQKAFLSDFLAQGGLTLKDVRLKSVGYELVPALVSGHADASFGGSWNVEGAKLRALGAKPVITRAQSLGAPSYEELALIARKDFLAENPGIAHRFISAVQRGTAIALKHPEAALGMMEEAGEINPKDSPRVIKAELKTSLPILSRTNRLPPRAVRGLVRWMHEKGMIRREIPIYEILSGQSPGA